MEYKGYVIKALPARLLGLWGFSVNGIRSVVQDFTEPQLAIDEAKALIDLDPTLFEQTKENV